MFCPIKCYKVLPVLEEAQKIPQSSGRLHAGVRGVGNSQDGACSSKPQSLAIRPVPDSKKLALDEPVQARGRCVSSSYRHCSSDFHNLYNAVIAGPDKPELPKSSRPHADEGGEILMGMHPQCCTTTEESNLSGRSGRALFEAPPDRTTGS
jgi:hypothetical protein